MAGESKRLVSHRTFIFLSAVLTIAESASIFDAFSSSISSLFTEQEEAPFTLVKEESGFEERQYDALNWVCSKETNIKQSSSSQQQDTFLQLFSYLERDNNDEDEIEMGIPVSIQFHRETLNSSAQLTACFYITGSFQTNPPIPTDTDLTITKRDPMTIFTRRFGGYINRPSEWLIEATKLVSLVTTAGKNVRRDLMYWNAFDSPAKFWNRRNEVWLVKEN